MVLRIIRKGFHEEVVGKICMPESVLVVELGYVHRLQGLALRLLGG